MASSYPDPAEELFQIYVMIEKTKMFDDNDNRTYKVVKNGEEQHSIWPADRENPLGWYDAGKSGTKQQCLEHIAEVWTDMRPLSLRKSMEAGQ
jgi:MbtH protein